MSRRCPAPEARAKAEEEFRRRNPIVTTPTPSDEVAQRARAAALEEAARIVEQPFTGIAHTEQERWRIRLVNDLARQIRALKHFTATNVERKDNQQ